MNDVTQILKTIQAGGRHASGELLPVVYDSLRDLAKHLLSSEGPNQTLQATALVHEAYIRVLGNQEDSAQWDSRNHFFGAAAQAMRRILVDNARKKLRVKHGGHLNRSDVEQTEIVCTLPDEELVALDDALEQLNEEDPVKARLVELRFFVGMTIDEAAAVLNIAPTTAKRYWRYARTMLHQSIRGD
ncbi:MAG: ECF-type sigma factor [Aureliella sp.]